MSVLLLMLRQRIDEVHVRERFCEDLVLFRSILGYTRAAELAVMMIGSFHKSIRAGKSKFLETGGLLSCQYLLNLAGYFPPTV